MEPTEERSRFPESIGDLEAMFTGKSPRELVAMTRGWLEARPVTSTLVGLGLGFALGRLLKRS